MKLSDEQTQYGMTNLGPKCSLSWIIILEREKRDARKQADLQAALVEALDGEDDAAAANGAEESAVDGAEAALAELERAAEAVGGAAELVEVEHPQPLRTPLLGQLLDAPGGHGRRRGRRLAPLPAATTGGGGGRRGRLGRRRRLGSGSRLAFGPALAALESEAPHLVTG